jgi:hypothetical protein
MRGPPIDREIGTGAGVDGIGVVLSVPAQSHGRNPIEGVHATKDAPVVDQIKPTSLAVGAEEVMASGREESLGQVLTVVAAEAGPDGDHLDGECQSG